MTIAEILSNFRDTDRANMIEHLKQARTDAQTRELNSVGSQNNEKNYINQLNGILSVIESGTKPAPHFLTNEEFQQLRSTVERFVEAGEFDQGQFDLLYGS